MKQNRKIKSQQCESGPQKINRPTGGVNYSRGPASALGVGGEGQGGEPGGTSFQFAEVSSKSVGNAHRSRS